MPKRKPAPAGVPDGWAQPDRAINQHYFRNGRSLCSRWLGKALRQVPRQVPLRTVGMCSPCHNRLVRDASA